MTNFCSTASSISGNLEEKVKCLHLGSVSLLAGNMFVIESFIACKYEKWQVLYRLLYTCVCVHTLYVLRTALRNSIIFFSFLLRMLYSLLLLLLLLHFHLFRENIKRRDAIVNKSRESTNVHRRDLPGRPFFFHLRRERSCFFFSRLTHKSEKKKEK
jgi:predicted ferric reductase